jgi:ribonucleotide reductase alpha subunit
MYYVMSYCVQVIDGIRADGGSVQRLAAVPADLKHIYRTVWEIPQKAIIDMAAGNTAH